MLYLLSGMRVVKILFLFHFFFSGNLFSQVTVDFTLTEPNYHLSYLPYKLIKITDQRDDTTNMGFLYGTIFKRLAYVRPNIDLKDQLQSILTYIADSTGNEDLLLQIRKMKFIQRSNAYEDCGLFFFRANLYSKDQNSYIKISSIDTLVIVENSDETTSLTKKASDIISNFIFNDQTHVSFKHKHCSYTEIIKIDSIEKSQSKAYCVGDYTNGVYTSFASFKKQIPDFKASKLKFRSTKLKKVYKTTGKNKQARIDDRNIFAVVEKGKMYISSEYGYYTLYKFNGDFYFIGKGSTNRDIEDVLPNLGGLFFYPINPVIITFITLTTSPKAYFEIKIDHVDGRFMRCKEIKNY